MPFATSPDGVRIHYETVGAGSPLALQTGGAGDGTMWRDAGYVESLARSYTCILIDHRGHGLSDRPLTPAEHRVERYVADIVAVLDGLGIDRAAYWGYSQGGEIGRELAAAHPRRLAALVTTGVVENPDRKAERRELVEALAELEEKGWDAIVPDFRNAAIPDWFKGHIENTDAAMVGLWWEANLDRTPWTRFPLIQAPVLMVVGEDEDPDRWNEQAARLIPRAEVLRLAGEDHLGAYVRSDLVMPTVIRFLNAVYP